MHAVLVSRDVPVQHENADAEVQLNIAEPATALTSWIDVARCAFTGRHLRDQSMVAVFAVVVSGVRIETAHACSCIMLNCTCAPCCMLCTWLRNSRNTATTGWQLAQLGCCAVVAFPCLLQSSPPPRSLQGASKVHLHLCLRHNQVAAVPPYAPLLEAVVILCVYACLACVRCRAGCLVIDELARQTGSVVSVVDWHAWLQSGVGLVVSDRLLGFVAVGS